MNGNPRLVFIGPLPPPIHGMAIVNARVVALLGERIATNVIKVAPDDQVTGILYHMSKGFRAACAVVRLAGARFKGARLLYASVDDRWGGLYTLFFVVLARGFGLRIWLHHHSYRYIVQKSRIMKALTISAGPGTTHIVLCEEMKAAFAGIYPAAKRFAIVPNAIDPPEPSPPTPKEGPLTIGLLANLTFEKGLAEFVDIIEKALAGGHNLRGILAGSAGVAEAKFIERSVQVLGGRLDWIGPVSGKAKEAFFASTDLFVFPTKSESFGLVLLEALVRGIPIIAPAHGCVCLFETLEAAVVVPLSDDFATRALESIARLAFDPALLEQMRIVARVEGLTLNAAHESSLRALVTTLVAEVESSVA